jgi:hypothetical protein
MALDPQIPLSAAQQPSYAKQAGEVYQLAGAIEKQQEYQQEKQDQQILQEGLKQEGINMTTSEGLMKLADWSKEHGVSVKSQGMVGQAISDSRKQDLEMRHLLAQQSLDNNKIGAEKKAEIGDQLSPIYDQWKQDVDTVGEEAANVNLQKNIQPAIEKIATKVDASGKPYYDPNVVKQLSGVNNGKALESELNRIESFRKAQQEIYNVQRTQQDISLSKKRELFIGKGTAGGAGSTTDFDTLPKSAQQLSRDYALNKLITGKDAPARGDGYKLQMMGLHALADELGTTPEELMAAGADVKTRLVAKTQVEKRIQALDRASNQLEAEIPVMETAMKGMDLPSIPIAARGKIIALRAMGDPAATKLDQAADAVFKEFETVISGNPGALYVGQMEDAKAKYKSIETPQQMREWIGGAKRIITNAKSANKKTREDTMSDIMDALHLGKPKGAEEKPTEKPKESTEVPRGAAPAKSGAAWSASDEARLKELEAKHGAQ